MTARHRIDPERVERHLRAVLDPGTVHARGPGYDGARRLWNGAVDRRPAAVVACSTAGEVAAAVRAARDLDVPLTVRGGGHGWSGAALGGRRRGRGPARAARDAVDGAVGAWPTWGGGGA
ncbi:FAD-binding protein, partial [Actinomadura sp. CNU-125]|uniref:FAD-binding protein n=1 Tax=Actinomadura sp. CNU-125 TaxID=1904961 RepID=UPI001177D757